MSVELQRAIQEDLAALREMTERMREDGIEAAKAEATYQAAKAKRVVELSQVCSAAQVGMRIKGDPMVNSYLMERECARYIWEADREAINTLKIAIRMAENQLQREWQG